MSSIATCFIQIAIRIVILCNGGNINNIFNFLQALNNVCFGRSINQRILFDTFFKGRFFLREIFLKINATFSSMFP